AWPDASSPLPRHDPGPGHLDDHPAPGSGPHAATPRLPTRSRDQGLRDRRRHRGAGADAPVPGGVVPDVPAVRDLHDGDARLLPDPLSDRAGRGPCVPAAGAARRVVTYDWGVVWEYRGLLLRG